MATETEFSLRTPATAGRQWQYGSGITAT